jgi:CheY-like chemotaxis protein
MPNILVIDSDPASRAALVHALTGLGVVEATGSSLDALRTLATTTFSVIVLDLHARPLDGFLILRALATRGGPNRVTPVYALAADVAEQDRALQAHAVFVLIKPISLATVKTLVEAGLNKPPPTDQSPPSPRVARTPTVRPSTVASTPPLRPTTEPPRPSSSSPPAKTSSVPPSDRR